MTPLPIVIDTDPGQDDALAILLALASPELAVLGITAVAGIVMYVQDAVHLAEEPLEPYREPGTAPR